MDTKIPPPPPPPSSSAAPPPSAAANFLSDLPSRGLFSTTPTIPSSNVGSMRVYICDHDTSPPESQLIKTDQMNILIRSLLLKKHHHHPRAVDSSAGGSRKRVAEKAPEGPGGKRAAVGEGDVLQCLTVDRLRMMLREKGLNVRGKKDDLIARLRSVGGGGGSSS